SRKRKRCCSPFPLPGGGAVKPRLARATGPARSGSPDRCAAPPAGKASGITVENAVARAEAQL
ncbi:TPA: hypothetical protein ACGQUO_003999, partial [Klebsiella oxytoca]